MGWKPGEVFSYAPLTLLEGLRAQVEPAEAFPHQASLCGAGTSPSSCPSILVHVISLMIKALNRMGPGALLFTSFQAGCNPLSPDTQPDI